MDATLPPHIEAASTLAVIASSNEPLLFLAGDLRVIAASASFCRAFGIQPGNIPGRQLSELGEGEWAAPQLTSLLNATASGSARIVAYEFELVRAGQPMRSLLLNASLLEDGDAVNVRMLLAITDITVARAEARHRDDLIREKTILLQEVQHRVANSLQIIASVLMQSARKVQSEEVRSHLQDAHHRVMSIAALQRQLAASTLGDVELRPYFTQLCQSLSASMIQDPDRLSITVSVDDSVVSANASVSLGLIVTELVINALKHAFPGQRHGRMTVEYRADGMAWELSVADDGVGMPKGPKAPTPGLGTGIVEALSRQLQAEITVTDTKPGTTIHLVHTAASDTGSDRPVAA